MLNTDLEYPFNLLPRGQFEVKDKMCTLTSVEYLTIHCITMIYRGAHCQTITVLMVDVIAA